MHISNHDRVLILAPHPDDEALATGGLIQRAVAAGAEVRVLFATNGDDNPWPQRVLEKRWRIKARDRQRWGAVRHREALAALSLLGMERDAARFLSLPDQGVTGLLLRTDETTTELLRAEIADFAPTLLVTPSAADRHPDHSALAVFVRLALARLGAGAARELHFIVHPAAGSQPPRRAVLHLTRDEKAVKRAAILTHKSQVMLSRRRFLAHARDTEVFYAPVVAARDIRFHPVRSAHLGAAILRFRLVLRSHAALLHD